jgi:DNA (cytosine-5)-methyltransferase 1
MSKIKVVDFFAGAGGFSTGAAIAGLEVVAAANHWSIAVESHTRNHPSVRHICQDLNLFDPSELPEFDLLTASPSCQGHAHARGKDQPRHDKSRATAWCVVDCAEIRRPRRIVVENVPEFIKWTLFPQWKSALEALGYVISVSVLNAKHFGVAQDRERVIIVCAHGEKAAPKVVSPMLPERSAIEVIDFTTGKWFPTSKYVEATQVRLRDGRAKGWDRFLAPYYGSGSGEIARSLDRPIGTITTLDRWLVVDGDRGRILTVPEVMEFMSFPKGYYLAGTRRDQVMQLGNAICPLMAAEVLRQVTG